MVGVLVLDFEFLGREGHALGHTQQPVQAPLPADALCQSCKSYRVKRLRCFAPLARCVPNAAGVCEATAQLLMMTGAAHLPGALLPLLMQTVLLWNLVFSSLMFGTRWVLCGDRLEPLLVCLWQLQQ
jgi:hypothetical protein